MEDKLKKNLDIILNKEITIASLSMKVVDYLFLLCIMLLGLVIRFSLRHIESGDWTGSLLEWTTAMRQDRTIRILGTDFGSNYNSPYLYILYLICQTNTVFSDMYFIKLVSVLFEYLTAFVMFAVIYHLTGSSKRAILAFSAALLAPTFFLNSAAWSQCDAIYTSFLLLSLYFILKEKSGASLIFMGIAFSFKIQAIFFLPFLIIMWLKNKVKTWHFLYIPLIYFISIAPMWLLGRSLKSLVGVYLGLTDFYSNLTLSYPNIYALINSNEITKYLSSAGTYLTIAFLGCIAYYLYTKKCQITAAFTVTLALFTTSVIVFCLPHMHERYGYMVDLLAIVYGFYHIRKLWMTIGFQMVSLIAYMPYLLKSEIVPLWMTSLFYLALIILTGYDLYKEIHQASYSENLMDQ